MERRKFLRSLGLGVASMYVSGKTLAKNAINSNSKNIMENYSTKEFPALPYSYDALEPFIDARTMEIHYDKHHRAYFTNFTNAVKGTPWENTSFEKLFPEISKAGDAIRNNAGGFYNHTLFWRNMSKNQGTMSAGLSEAINKSFGSFDKFKEALSNAGKTRFGSGWAWLYLTSDKKLALGSTPNQDNPLMDISPIKGTPLLCLDVWEHAYYLKYQNKRPDYIEAWWNVVNWNEVNKRFADAMK